MNRISTILPLVSLLLFAACSSSSDPNGSYPATYVPTGTTATGMFHLYYNDGGVWKEGDTTGSLLLDRPEFDSAFSVAALFPLILRSDSTFDFLLNGNLYGPFPYEISGGIYHFEFTGTENELYGRMIGDELHMYRVTLLQFFGTGDSVFGTSVNVFYDPRKNIVDDFGDATTFDTLAYRTHEVVFRREE